MMHGRNNGKKIMAVRIMRHTFEIINLTTGEVRSVLHAKGSDSAAKTSDLRVQSETARVAAGKVD